MSHYKVQTHHSKQQGQYLHEHQRTNIQLQVFLRTELCLSARILTKDGICTHNPAFRQTWAAGASCLRLVSCCLQFPCQPAAVSRLQLLIWVLYARFEALPQFPGSSTALGLSVVDYSQVHCSLRDVFAEVGSPHTAANGSVGPGICRICGRVEWIPSVSGCSKAYGLSCPRSEREYSRPTLLCLGR